MPVDELLSVEPSALAEAAHIDGYFICGGLLFSDCKRVVCGLTGKFGGDMNSFVRTRMLICFSVLGLFFGIGVGVVQAETLAALARLSVVAVQAPTGLALDNNETLYVVESANSRVVVIENSGQRTAALRGFKQPLSVAVDQAGRVYVGDGGSGSVLVFGADLVLQGRLGTGDGEFGWPVGISVNAAGDVFVVDKDRNNVRIYGANRQLKLQFGQPGSTAGQLNHPLDIAVDSGSNEIVIVDRPLVLGSNGYYEGSRIQFFDQTGKYLRGGGQNGVGEGQLAKAVGVAVDQAGKVYVSDSYQNIVETFDRTGKYIETVYDAAAPMRNPVRLAIGGISGRLFVSSVSGNRVDVYGKQAQHVVTAESTAGGSITPSGAFTVTHGASVDFKLVAEAGYHVKRLSVDGTDMGAVSEYRLPVVVAGHALRAEFGADEHTVLVESTGGGMITPSGALTVLSHENVTLAITPATGFKVADVLVDGLSVGPQASYTLSNVMADHTVRAVFAQQQYTITATADGNGSINPSGALTVFHGSEKTCTFTPQSGYRIGGVAVDGKQLGPMSSYTFTNITADHEISVTFLKITHQISTSSSAGGSIYPGGTIAVEEGTDVDFLMIAEQGYHISGLLVDNDPIVLTNRYIFTDVGGPHCIRADFAKNHYAISLTIVGEGSVSPSGPIVVEYGETKSITLLPANKHHVAVVMVDGQAVAINDSYTFTDIRANYAVSVLFEKDNEPPIALAGPDQKVAGGIIKLNGANSFDPDGEIKTYLWEQTVGLPVTLINPNQASTSFTASEVDANGASLMFKLTVTDDLGVSSEDECLVHLVRDYQPPVADAGPDQAVPHGAKVILDGSGSYDRDGVIVSYQWRQIGGRPVDLTAAEFDVATFTAPTDGTNDTVLAFRLLVADSTGLLADQECLVNITAADQKPPFAEAGADQIVREGETVLLNGSGSSAASGISSYLWTQAQGTPAVNLDNFTTAYASFKAPQVETDGTPFTYQLLVTDQNGLVGRDSITVVVYKALSGRDSAAPGNVNKTSKGKWITLSIELPNGLSCEAIDVNSIAVTRGNGQRLTPALFRSGPLEISDSNKNGIPDLTVKFDRQQLGAVLDFGPAILTVSGRLVDGTAFQEEFRVDVLE